MTTHINQILRTGADLAAADKAADSREVGRLMRRRQQQIVDALQDGVRGGTGQGTAVWRSVP